MRNLKIKNIHCHASLVMMKDSQNGRSMIEMLGVLAIIGVLSVGGIAGYSKAMTKYRINKTIEQIILTISNVQTFYASQKTYEGLGTIVPWKPNDNFSLIEKAKLVPDEMIDGINIKNAFDGRVDLVTADKNSDNDNKAAAASFSFNSEEACIEILSHDWSNISGLISIQFGGDDRDLKSAKNGCDYNGENRVVCRKNLPISIDKAVEYCAEGVGSIDFKFY